MDFPRVEIHTRLANPTAEEQRLWVGKWTMTFAYELSEEQIAEGLIAMGEEILRVNRMNNSFPV